MREPKSARIFAKRRQVRREMILRIRVQANQMVRVDLITEAGQSGEISIYLQGEGKPIRG